MLFNLPLKSVEQEEELVFRPRFDDKGLITAVTTNEEGKLLMVAHMNEEALAKTLETGQAWYYSRSRNKLWLKGETSGQIQHIIEIRTDCDQDALWLKVRVGGDGGACHTGRDSCFYRVVKTTSILV
jgi:phosphoribosyl-AMP cyclohydrolase